MTYRIHQPEKNVAKGKGGSVIKYFEKKEFEASIVDYFKLGEWKGKGAERMGMLNAPILEGELEQWGKTFHPKTGEKMGKNSKNGLDDAYLQTVFSPPKDFSLIYFLDTTLQKQLEEDWNYTLDKMHEFIEQFGETRVDSFNNLENIGLVTAQFKHETARATDKKGVEIRPDPQLHAHMLVSRLGIDKEGKGRKFENRKLFFNQLSIGTYGRAVLADRLRERGFSIEKHTEYQERKTKNGVDRVKVNSFRIVGITQEQRDFFSNRSSEIHELEEKYGTHSTKSRDLIANNNKKAKKEYSRNELIEVWKKDGEKLGLTNDYIQSIKNLGNKSILDNIKTDEELFSSIIVRDNMYHKDIMARLYEYQQYTGIKAEDVLTRWTNEKKLEQTKNFQYKCKIDLKFTDKRKAQLKMKKSSSPDKVLAVAFSVSHCLSEVIDGLIDAYLLNLIIKQNNKRNQRYDEEEKELAKEETKRISNLNSRRSVKKEASNDNKIEVDTTFQIAESIKGVEAQIGTMHQKLLDPKVSEASKAKIAAKMEQLASKLVMLKKKKLNAGK